MRLPGKTVEDVDKKGLTTVDTSSLTFGTNLDVPSVLRDKNNDMPTMKKVSAKLILGGDINNVPFDEMRVSKNIYIFGREFADIFRALGDKGLDKNTIGRLLFKLTKIDFSSEKEKIALDNYIQSLKNNKVKQLEEIENITGSTSNEMINTIAPGDSETKIVNINRGTKPQINSILDKAKEEEIISNINRFYIDSNQKNTAIKSMLNISEFFGDDLDLYEFYVDILSGISGECSTELFNDIYEVSSIFHKNRTGAIAKIYNIDIDEIINNKDKKEIINTIVNILKKVDLSRGNKKITSTLLLIYLNNLERFGSEYAEMNLKHSNILDLKKEYKTIISILETDLPYTLKSTLKENFIKLFYYIDEDFDKVNNIIETSEKYGSEFFNFIVRSEGALKLEYKKTIDLLSNAFDKIKIFDNKIDSLNYKYKTEEDNSIKEKLENDILSLENKRAIERREVFRTINEALAVVEGESPFITKEDFGKFAKKMSLVLGKNKTKKIIGDFEDYEAKDRYKKIRNKYKLIGIEGDDFEKIFNITDGKKGLLNKFYNFTVENNCTHEIPAVLDSLLALKWIYEEDDDIDDESKKKRKDKMNATKKFFSIATHLFKMLKLNNGEELLAEVKINADQFDNISVFKDFIKKLKRTA